MKRGTSSSNTKTKRRPKMEKVGSSSSSSQRTGGKKCARERKEKEKEREKQRFVDTSTILTLIFDKTIIINHATILPETILSDQIYRGFRHLNIDKDSQETKRSNSREIFHETIDSLAQKMMMDQSEHLLSENRLLIYFFFSLFSF